MKAVMIAGAVAGCGMALSAMAVPMIDLQIDRPGTAARATEMIDRADLMRRWASVGRCVVGRDRNASVAFVRAPMGSDDASAAARRLDPVFASCLAGSRVPGPSSIVLRRAAIANALGLARGTT